MVDKFQNRYRIPSARWQNWDYGSDAAYFITICTNDRSHYFGEIENCKMVFSHVGVLADVFWHEIKNHAKNIELGAFQVMPNHIHGILILVGNENTDTVVETRHALSLPETTETTETTENTENSYQPHTNLTIGQQRIRNQGKNTISSIVGSYKSAITKHANRLNLKIKWQSRFHDHIVRDDGEYSRITEYIINNVANWSEDKFFHHENQE